MFEDILYKWGTTPHVAANVHKNVQNQRSAEFEEELRCMLLLLVLIFLNKGDLLRLFIIYTFLSVSFVQSEIFF